MSGHRKAAVWDVWEREGGGEAAGRAQITEH